MQLLGSALVLVFVAGGLTGCDNGPWYAPCEKIAADVSEAQLASFARTDRSTSGGGVDWDQKYQDAQDALAEDVQGCTDAGGTVVGFSGPDFDNASWPDEFSSDAVREQNRK